MVSMTPGHAPTTGDGGRGAVGTVEPRIGMMASLRPPRGFGRGFGRIRSADHGRFPVDADRCET